MHLPDHFLDPATMAISGLFSGGAVVYALARVRREAESRALPAAGLAAGIFAAQMVNFPVAAGTSGHLVGGALAGMLLGPWMGMSVMSAVLAVQAVVFGDGGILALGANILNMGLIGVAIGVLVQRMLASRTPSAGRPVMQAVAAALAGWLSVIVAALACAIEMAVSGAASAGEVVPAMLGVHAMIGLAEAAITAVAVAACAVAVRLSERPESASWSGHSLATAHCSQRAVAHGKFGWCAMLAPAVLVVALAPFASTLPDGLESVAVELSWIELRAGATVPSVLADYAVPGVTWPGGATVLAGMLGIVLVYGVTMLAGIGVRRSGGL